MRVPTVNTELSPLTSCPASSHCRCPCARAWKPSCPRAEQQAYHEAPRDAAWWDETGRTTLPWCPAWHCRGTGIALLSELLKEELSCCWATNFPQKMEWEKLQISWQLDRVSLGPHGRGMQARACNLQAMSTAYLGL